jgi:hypothetical protein
MKMQLKFVGIFISHVVGTKCRYTGMENKVLRIFWDGMGAEGI